MNIGDKLVDRLNWVAAALSATGMNGSLTRSKVNAPGFWVTPQLMSIDNLDGSGTARLHVFLIAPTGQDDLTVLKTLSGLLSKALTVLTPDEDVDTSYTVALPHTPAATFPAFRLVVDVDL